MDKNPGHRALRTGRVSLPNHAYLITTTTRGRLPLFRNHHVARIACRTLAEVSGDAGIDALTWVLMPDHLHLLGVLGSGQTLAAGVGHIKSAIAREMNRRSGASGPVWARAYHDRAMRSEDNLLAAARYIIANPVRAGLVQSVRDYPYWDSIWLHG